VQRLVAAAVPGLAPERVVVTDQRGVTLSSADAGAVGAGAVDARLQIKREIEDYIAHKVARLLDRAFGPGQSLVSVDAALNFDATKTTIQDLLPGGSGAVEGRVVRRRQLTGSATAEPAWTSTVDGTAAPARSPSTSLEVEFEYGRRIDEIIAAPGAITRISVGVVIPDAVTDERRAKVSELVRMAAGIDERRGDAITVQPLSQMDRAPKDEPDVEPVRSESAARTESEVSQQRIERGIVPSYSLGLIAVLVLFAIGAIALIVRRRPATRALSDHERQDLLDDIQRALAEELRAPRGHAR
jgi:flagellar M-ring protein FliF